MPLGYRSAKQETAAIEAATTARQDRQRGKDFALDRAVGLIRPCLALLPLAKIEAQGAGPLMTKLSDLPKLRRLARAVLLLAFTFGLGITAIWGFIEGREELAQEAERERPVKPPSRISIEGGEMAITLDAIAQGQSGIQTATLQQTQYHKQLHAYATVLDLQALVDLHNSYALAKAQLKSAQAKLDASSAEFGREDSSSRPRRVLSLSTNCRLLKRPSTQMRRRSPRRRHSFGRSPKRQSTLGGQSLGGRSVKKTQCLLASFSVRTIWYK